jgi:hypothetical protein
MRSPCPSGPVIHYYAVAVFAVHTYLQYLCVAVCGVPSLPPGTPLLRYTAHPTSP